MTEDAYWEIWDNISEVRFGSDVDTMDDPNMMDKPDITDDDGEEYGYDDEDVAEIIPEGSETFESYIDRRILEEDKREFCVAFHPNHPNKNYCTEPFTKP